MNIIFLDIDGILNSHKFEIERDINSTEAYIPYYSDIDPKRIKLLQKILNKFPNIKIVISSSWRDSLSVKEFKNLFSHFGINSKYIIDKTSDNMNKQDSIKKWIKENNVNKFIILDDDNLFSLNDKLFNHFYKIKSSSIDEVDVKKIINKIEKSNS